MDTSHLTDHIVIMIMKCIVLAAPVLIISIVKEDLKPAANAGASELMNIMYRQTSTIYILRLYCGIKHTNDLN